jgi:predicted HTH domain antitoxin
VWRLFNVGYVNAKTREELQDVRWPHVLTALGIRESDDPTEGPRKTSPERLRDMAVEAYRRGRISIGKLADYLGLTLTQAKEFVHKARIEPEDDEA